MNAVINFITSNLNMLAALPIAIVTKLLNRVSLASHISQTLGVSKPSLSQHQTEYATTAYWKGAKQVKVFKANVRIKRGKDVVKPLHKHMGGLVASATTLSYLGTRREVV